MRLSPLKLGALIALAFGGHFALAQLGPPATNFTGNPLTQRGSHMIAGGPAPTLSSGCGTGAAIGGSDTASNLQTGTGTSQPCTITFAQSFGSKPMCVVTSETATVSYVLAANGASMDLTSLVDLTRYRFICFGHP